MTIAELTEALRERGLLAVEPRMTSRGLFFEFGGGRHLMAWAVMEDQPSRDRMLDKIAGRLPA